jgi:hypothetical protein
MRLVDRLDIPIAFCHFYFFNLCINQLLPLNEGGKS